MALMIGNCFYCGQQRMVEGATGEEGTAKLNELATQQCTCDAALKTRDKRDIPKRVQELFGGKCKELGFAHECDEDALEVLVHVACGVAGGRFQDVKVKLLCGDMAVFKASEEGLVKISREMKRKRTL